MKNFNELYQKGIWVTKDGRELNVSDLDNDHLMNVWAMMVRQLKIIISDFQIQPYLKGPKPQGEHAQDAFWFEFSRVLEGDLVTLDQILMHPIMPYLYQEAQKRGLDVKI